MALESIGNQIPPVTWYSASIISSHFLTVTQATGMGNLNLIAERS